MLPERIGKKYEVIRKIASGGMAEIYLCRLTGEEGFEKKVAVKVIQSRLSEEDHFRGLFIREARIAASLTHPNLIQVFDFGREGRSYHLAMEYIDGWNLAQAISQARQRSLQVPLPVWRYWMEGVLEGLGHLHSRGIVHRDISPSNVLLSRGGVVKITDFGIARGGLHDAGTTTGWEGKFAYMSPELAQGEEASATSDLFAAAVISAELFLPGRLFEGGSAEEMLSRLRQYDAQALDLRTLPPAVADTVRKGLSTAKTDRYTDADEFSRAVCAAVPAAAARADLQSFWDALFPIGHGEEDTIVDASFPERRQDVVRESRSGYGKRDGRLVKIGVLAALTAITVGGWAAWKGSETSKQGRSQPVGPPGSAGTGSSAVHPASSPATLPAYAAGHGEPRPLLPAVERGGEAKGSVSPPGKIPMAAPRVQPQAAAPEPPARSVLVETDPGGVSLTLDDGTPLGRTPVSLDPAPWSGRKIVFHQEGYIGKSVEADVLARFKTFRLEMERQMGTIGVIQAIPWAKVFDGEKYLGDTPINNVKLPVGPHRLRFVNEPLAMERVQEVDVHPGINPKLIVSLVGKKQSD